MGNISVRQSTKYKKLVQIILKDQASSPAGDQRYFLSKNRSFKYKPECEYLCCQLPHH